MTDFQTQINENADSLERLLSIIVELEERIIDLEKRLVTAYTVNPSDSYYWEHG